MLLYWNKVSIFYLNQVSINLKYLWYIKMCTVILALLTFGVR